MTNKILLINICIVLILFPALQNNFTYAGNTAAQKLTKTIIIQIFFELKNEIGRPYKLSNIKWKEGHFSSIKAHEAVVSFKDYAQSHSTGWGEIWLCRLGEDKWGTQKKLIDAGDKAWFELVDLESDGKSELWITMYYGNNGYFNYFSKLISLDNSCKESVLFSNSGFNNLYAGVSGQAIKEHNMCFFDIDSDGILEILDSEITQDIQWTGKGPGSYYNVVGVQKVQHIFKLKSGKFIKTKFIEAK